MDLADNLQMSIDWSTHKPSRCKTLFRGLKSLLRAQASNALNCKMFARKTQTLGSSLNIVEANRGQFVLTTGSQ